MLVNSVFGEIEIDEKGILEFMEGLIGLPTMKRYSLLNVPDNPLTYMQSLDNRNLCFPLIDPFKVIDNYSYKLSEEVRQGLEVTDANDIITYTIVVIPENISEIRTNLLSPIIINSKNGKAIQVVLSDTNYVVRHNIYDAIKKMK